MSASAGVRQPRRLVPLKEAAAVKSCHVDTLRRRIARGELRAYRLGNRIIRVDLDEVDALFKPIPTASSGER
jgi:excisionase family DNA binding protein